MAARLIIAMTGLARSGKNTVGAHLVKKHGFVRDAFADDLRRSLYAINPPVIATGNGQPYEMLADFVDRAGWDLARQHPGVQGLLQRAGTEGGRMIHGEHLWIDKVEARMKTLPKDIPLVITDCRTPQEGAWVRKHGGAIFRVERLIPTQLNAHLGDHSTEADTVDHDFLVVNNDSLASLHAQVDAVLAMSVDHRRIRR